MKPNTPEPWLRGPMPGIPAMLQPVAFALIQAQEEVEAVVRGLSTDQLWRSVGGTASVGFHLMHLAGSTDRLLTYARDEPLSDVQRSALRREREATDGAPLLDQLLRDWNDVVRVALHQLGSTSDDTLADPRLVGRAQLPSTVLGLLFHAAEHAARHTGQIVTTVRILRQQDETGEATGNED